MMKRRLFFFFLFFLLTLNIFAQREHVVLRGETFASISRKYGLTENELTAANPAKTVCYAGMKLIIPEKKEIVTSTPSIKVLSTSTTASYETEDRICKSVGQTMFYNSSQSVNGNINLQQEKGTNKSNRRIGTFYYAEESGSVREIKFLYENGEYVAKGPSIYDHRFINGYILYVLDSEDANNYIFCLMRVVTSGNMFTGYTKSKTKQIIPNSNETREAKMIVRKDWKSIIIPQFYGGRSNGYKDLVLTKEVPKEYGSKKIMEYNMVNSYYVDKVLNGNGVTINSYSGNSSTSSHSNGRRCSGCGGTGNCSMCKGKSWYRNAYDSYDYGCPSCNGTGECKVCHGKGTIY